MLIPKSDGRMAAVLQPFEMLSLGGQVHLDPVADLDFQRELLSHLESLSPVEFGVEDLAATVARNAILRFK